MNVAAFGISAAWLGFVLGTWIGATWFVPDGSGLAGPAIALFYGLGCAASALFASIVTMRRVSGPRFTRLARVTLLLGLAVAIGLVGWVAIRTDPTEVVQEGPTTLPVRR